ncbi:hypothetical protein [Pseudonocardia sp.]|uniref:hypothetical protein n=1 Tax=Pseudonocardia sp. TaxID=60912 RepID=UPI0026017290|nr:hypothetical protein [Pseudonocardia sp.]MCW2716835.1 hypothetical protein [Pseudonocardia sp.]
MITFEDWLISQTSAQRPRSTLAQLMLDGRFAEVDLGARGTRDALRRLLDDFERDAAGQWVRSTPLPRRSSTGAPRSPVGS